MIDEKSLQAVARDFCTRHPEIARAVYEEMSKAAVYEGIIKALTDENIRLIPCNNIA